jgi:NAD(P)-dependent dehydrogenase (short-subunit alcohol dehydrogenase family)
MGSPYGSSKAALWAVTRCVAMENAEFDILINGLIPGPTKTSMMPWGQKPEKVYPSARWLATLPKGGPTGKVFWNKKEYVMFDKENVTFNLFIRDTYDWKKMIPFDSKNNRSLD